MKIDKSFRIELSSNRSCRDGGSNHTMVKMFDNFGRQSGFYCSTCGEKRYVKGKHRKLKSKILL